MNVDEAISTAKKQIEVMEAFKQGKTIECIRKNTAPPAPEWQSNPSPSWTWGKFDYRIKEEPLTVFGILHRTSNSLWNEIARNHPHAKRIMRDENLRDQSYEIIKLQQVPYDPI